MKVGKKFTVLRRETMSNVCIMKGQSKVLCKISNVKQECLLIRFSCRIRVGERRQIPHVQKDTWSKHKCSTYQLGERVCAENHERKESNKAIHECRHLLFVMFCHSHVALSFFAVSQVALQVFHFQCHLHVLVCLNT